MKTVHYKAIPTLKFDNDVAKGVAGRVLIGKADGAANFCMRLFELEKGGHTPRHTHAWEHEIFVHAGEGEVFLGSDWKRITPGTAVFIPGDQAHQIRALEESSLVFVCLIPSGVEEL